jgi:preprotein translocase subunit SecG
VLATAFFILSLALAYAATQKPVEGGGVMDAVRQQQPAKPEEKKAAPETKPAAPAPASPPSGKEVPQ